MESSTKHSKLKLVIQYGLFLLGLVAIGFAFLPHLIGHTVEAGDKSRIISCPKSKNTVEVKVGDQGFEPKQIKASSCDMIHFTNVGKNYHDLAFGPHPTHLSYPGFNEKTINPGQSQSLLLTAWGSYQIHDHLHDELEASLEIAK